MKKMTSILLLLAATISLTGCNEADTSHPPKTVGWFLRTSGRACGGSQGVPRQPGELAKTPNCINANEARNKVTVQEMKDALK